MMCPCDKVKPYQFCCEPFHNKEKKPQSALLLMKSRFSAFAMKRADYLIETIYPKGPLFHSNYLDWELSLLKVAQATEFLNLEIVDHRENLPRAEVIFRVECKRDGEKKSYQEHSDFIFENSTWYFVNSR